MNIIEHSDEEILAIAHPMWDDLVKGAIGAVVVVDTSRLEDCFAAVDCMRS